MNYLGKFSPSSVEVCEPLTKLISLRMNICGTAMLENKHNCFLVTNVRPYCSIITTSHQWLASMILLPSLVPGFLVLLAAALCHTSQPLTRLSCPAWCVSSSSSSSVCLLSLVSFLLSDFPVLSPPYLYYFNL